MYKDCRKIAALSWLIKNPLLTLKAWLAAPFYHILQLLTLTCVLRSFSSFTSGILGHLYLLLKYTIRHQTTSVIIYIQNCSLHTIIKTWLACPPFCLVFTGSLCPTYSRGKPSLSKSRWMTRGPIKSNDTFPKLCSLKWVYLWQTWTATKLYNMSSGWPTNVLFIWATDKALISHKDSSFEFEISVTCLSALINGVCKAKHHLSQGRQGWQGTNTLRAVMKFIHMVNHTNHKCPDN